MSKRIVVLITCLLMSSIGFTSTHGKKRDANITLKIATIAPEGSLWMKEFRTMAKEVEEQSNGRVHFKIYPGGIMGSDDVVLRKMRVGQLDGANFTSKALAKIQKDFLALTLPQVFKTTDEVDYILNRFGEEFKKKFHAKGYEVLAFSSLGFTYMFTKHPIKNADDLKKAKPWLWQNDPVMVALYKAANTTPISVDIGDVMTALETGLLDTVFNTPTGILALQWFTKVKYMTNLPLTHAFGAFIISKRSWKKIPEDLQQLIRERVAAHIASVTEKLREEDSRALDIIAKRGVTIETPSEQLVSDFRSISDSAKKMLLKKKVSARFMRKIEAELNAYRALHKHP